MKKAYLMIAINDKLYEKYGREFSVQLESLLKRFFSTHWAMEAYKR